MQGYIPAKGLHPFPHDRVPLFFSLCFFHINEVITTWFGQRCLGDDEHRSLDRNDKCTWPMGREVGWRVSQKEKEMIKPKKPKGVVALV